MTAFAMILMLIVGIFIGANGIVLIANAMETQKRRQIHPSTRKFGESPLIHN